MIPTEFPLLLLLVALPLLGALLTRWQPDPDVARRQSLVIAVLVLVGAVGAWIDLALPETSASPRPRAWAAADFLKIDDLSAPVLVLAALQYFLTILATLRTKFPRFSFPGLLASEGILLATLASPQGWIMIGLLALGAFFPWFELRAHGKPTRVYVLHMVLFVALLVAGQALASHGPPTGASATLGVTLLAAAVMLRGGVAPLHFWMTDLFDKAMFGTALLFVTPMVGAYATVRLVLPTAPDWLLRAMVFLSLFTAVYAAGMALVQRDSRRFFCFVFLSHSSLVFVGLETSTPIGLTSGLCMWLAVGLSLTGFGLTLRSVEARAGRLALDRFHGLYDHTAPLATLFLLTGLASIGFPGTVGFVGAELLVESTVQYHPLLGIVLVIAAALNGLAILQAYFRIFTGTRRESSIDLRGRPAERIAVLILAAMILGGGLYPQPGVASRYAAATRLFELRQRRPTAIDGATTALEDRTEQSSRRLDDPVGERTP